MAQPASDCSDLLHLRRVAAVTRLGVQACAPARRRPAPRRRWPRRRATPRAARPEAPGRRRSSAPRAASPIAFIAFRRSVASSSLWPPERKAIPGTASGTTRRNSARCARRLLDAGLLGIVVTGEHHVRLQDDALELDALGDQLGEDRLEHRLGDLLGTLDRMLAVHQHLGLDDRRDACLLAERRVASKRVRIDGDRVVVGRSSPIAITARHLAKRAPRSRYSARRSRRPSSPSVTVSSIRARERLRTGIDLDSRDHPELGNQLRERVFRSTSERGSSRRRGSRR